MLKRNADLTFREVPARATDEHYARSLGGLADEVTPIQADMESTLAALVDGVPAFALEFSLDGGFWPLLVDLSGGGS